MRVQDNRTALLEGRATFPTCYCPSVLRCSRAGHPIVVQLNAGTVTQAGAGCLSLSLSKRRYLAKQLRQSHSSHLQTCAWQHLQLMRQHHKLCSTKRCAMLCKGCRWAGRQRLKSLPVPLPFGRHFSLAALELCLSSGVASQPSVHFLSKLQRRVVSVPQR